MVERGDCLDKLRLLPDGSVDAVVTDPPAGIGFMGKGWDDFSGTSNYGMYGGRFFSVATPRIGAHKANVKEHSKARAAFVTFMTEVMCECLRVLKPGGHAFVWAIPRTSHWTATAIEDAGFEIRDRFSYWFFNGFPKSLRVEGGRGTAAKPACEDWILGRKPLVGTVAQNVARYGTGALNIDACRIPTEEKLERVLGKTTESESGWRSANRSPVAGKDGGRWPSHLLLSHSEECEPVEEIVVKGDDRAQTCKWMKRGEPCRGHGNVRFGKTFHSGTRPGGFAQPGAPGGSPKPNGVLRGDATRVAWRCVPGCQVAELDAQAGIRRSGGSASRFFYVAKPSRRERDAGLEDFVGLSGGAATGRVDGSAGLNSPRAGAGRSGGSRNRHPTVKSIDLMRYLCRLITPPGGVVLDPFCGSGSTGCGAVLEGLRFVGFEADFGDEGYVEIARARIGFWAWEREKGR